MNNQVIRTEPKPWCPECGARMNLRRPKQTQNWPPFWGCSEYPDCLGSRDILLDGKPDYSDEYIG